MANNLDRRSFLAAAGLSAVALTAGRAGAQAAGGAAAAPAVKAGGAAGTRPVVISSANGSRATAKAREMLLAGADPLDAIVAGVAIVEDDPNDNSVGYGGLPNEEGIVELDASVMYGPTHRAGAVASLRNIKNPAAVAREVARRTDHVLLVGEGALKFAKRMGFKEEDLLTEASREAWVKWRAMLAKGDNWLEEGELDLPMAPTTGEQKKHADARGAGDASRDAALTERKYGGEAMAGAPGVAYTNGTIHCAAVTPNGDIASCTSTSGLSWKLAGRVGDSPIIGAGNYCDNAVGAAGATGRGEAVIQVCGARTIVALMESGMAPTEACLAVLKMIADRTRAKRLLNAKGQPAFGVTMCALRKDGAYGSASMHEGGKFSVCDEKGERLESGAFLFAKG